MDELRNRLVNRSTPANLWRDCPQIVAQVNGYCMSTLNCALCSQPVNLTIDLACDETGKAVHEQCYVDRITGGKDTVLPPPAFLKFVAPSGLRPERHAIGVMTSGVRPK